MGFGDMHIFCLLKSSQMQQKQSVAFGMHVQCTSNSNNDANGLPRSGFQLCLNQKQLAFQETGSELRDSHIRKEARKRGGLFTSDLGHAVFCLPFLMQW